MKSIISIFVFLFIAVLATAQISTDVTFSQNIEVTENGALLKHPFAGGLNNPMWYKADLDNDGLKDYVIFEKQGNGLNFVTKTFLQLPNQEYKYTQEFDQNFPSIWNFATLIDYNCDRIEDLFTYSSLMPGIAVFQGYYDAQNRLTFRLEKSVLECLYRGAVQPVGVSIDEFISIVDMDNDGDLDISSFGGFNSRINLYTNLSQENNFGCDSLFYKYNDDCWGRISENAITSIINLSSRIDSCPGAFNWTPLRNQMHSGSTLLHLDMNNDGVKEALIGDIGISSITLANNGGTRDTAFITSLQSNFPTSHPVDLSLAPMPFHLDIDEDGDRDLVFSPYLLGGAENRKVAWLYNNIGTDEFPDFSFVQEDFFVNQMIDHGEDAFPTFFDYNRDGLMDIIIGNKEWRRAGNPLISQLKLYKNIGTLAHPKFDLITNDFGGLSQYVGQSSFRGLAPSFGDFDNDGDKDMVLGSLDGSLIYVRNGGGSGVANFSNTPIPSWQNIDIGASSTPYIIDVNNDGKLDLLVGELSGNINYFENTGTLNAPIFNRNIDPNGNAIPTTNSWGMVDTRGYSWDGSTRTTGYSRPVLIHSNGTFHLYTTEDLGTLRRYSNIYSSPGITNSAFVFADSLFGGIDVGYHSSADIADINGDGKLDYVVGNNCGGIALYSEGVLETIVGIEEIKEEKSAYQIFPNPTTNLFTIKSLDHQRIQKVAIYNSIGVLQNTFYDIEKPQISLDVENYPNGLYFIEISNQFGKSYLYKIIKRN
jgi:Secretion system C-terminal sorting domain/FG-GAP-like repeat